MTKIEADIKKRTKKFKPVDPENREYNKRDVVCDYDKHFDDDESDTSRLFLYNITLDR